MIKKLGAHRCSGYVLPKNWESIGLTAINKIKFGIASV